MASCEKCWGDAYMRTHTNPMKSQAEHYQDLIKERREEKACTPEQQAGHEMRCNSCGQIMDLRDLSQVFAHEDCNGIPIDYASMEQIPHSGAQKIGEPTLYTKKCGDVGLN